MPSSLSLPFLTFCALRTPICSSVLQQLRKKKMVKGAVYLCCFGPWSDRREAAIGCQSWCWCAFSTFRGWFNSWVIRRTNKLPFFFLVEFDVFHQYWVSRFAPCRDYGHGHSKVSINTVIHWFFRATFQTKGSERKNVNVYGRRQGI